MAPNSKAKNLMARTQILSFHSKGWLSFNRWFVSSVAEHFMHLNFSWYNVGHQSEDQRANSQYQQSNKGKNYTLFKDQDPENDTEMAEYPTV